MTRPADLETLAVHAGRMAVPTNVSSSPPLFQSSSYEFSDLHDVEAIYAGDRPGAIYGRYGGPNATQFEAVISALEGAEAAAGAASGMAAIDAALDAALSPARDGGRGIVATHEIYGGTHALLAYDYAARGTPVTAVDQNDLAAVEAALARTGARVLYVEALTNPLVHVADLPELARIAHAADALLVVDATFATPCGIRPIAHGADLVVHSVGKYLGGHGDVGAGVVAGAAELVSRGRSMLVRRGATMPHFEAWLAVRGIRTLALRMARHTANAASLAAWLAARPEVERVHHPSRPDHPQHALAADLYPHGTGGIVAFRLHGGRAAVDRFLRGLDRIAIVHSLGEVATTISYPVVSSHRPVPAAEREALGITDGTLRISAGIEAVEDIVADLERAFEALAVTLR